ncbi:neuropilin and tolloid-like protein 1 [Littorina saxatilis]|uniref:CUB domain-containing protein n=1 Tax=Littorina saxatilis TaxID=31220 RepID=A0AAN9GNE3_9CAEN
MWSSRPFMWELCVFLLSSMLLRLATAYSKSYVMEDYCDDLIDLEYNGLSMVHVRLTELGIYRPHMSCTFAVRAPPMHRLTLVMEWIDIAEGRFGYCSDYLAVLEGDLNKTYYTDNMDAKLCGQKKPAAITSSRRGLTLHFDSNQIEEGAGFSAVFTSFHEGSCQTGEFSCENGRCIDQRLKCDKYDNCGDFSDDCLLTVGDVVAAVIITSIVFLLIVGGAVLYCYRDKIKFRKKCPVIGANPDGVYHPTTEPAGKDDGATEQLTAV